MTKPKDGEDKKISEDWAFSVVGTKLKDEDKHNPAESRVKEIKRGIPKKQKLILDTGSVPRTKTRSAMAMELQGEIEKDEGDVYSLAPEWKRGIAFIIDLFFTVGILHSVKVAAPFLRKLIQFFLDNYKLQFIVSEAFVMNTIIVVSGFAALFFLIVIPVAFFNYSLGKKILGLRVRGGDKYTISISQALSRELIMKPLSILIIAGFVTPFFSKRKLSIHDMITHTFVIED